MIWLFGFFENFFTDPLFAGRFVSVLIGAITALGVYKVTQKLFSNKIAFIAALLYSIIPMFVFYNRQALLEAGVACIGIWSFHALLNLLRNPTTRNGIILGVILGLGFFIKSSSLLFIVSSICIFIFYIIKKRRFELVKSFGISIIAIICVDFLLLIQPLFWQTFSSNSRYSFTPAEFFTFPLSVWLNHFLGFFEIGFVFVTPFIFLAGIIGMFMMRRNKIKDSQIFILYFIFALTLEIFSAKSQNQRYIVSFFPFLVIPASYVLSFIWKGAIWRKSVVIVSFILPLSFSLMLIFNPESYILQMSKVSKYSNMEHIRGQMSGYGIKEVMHYIKEHSIPSQPTLVFFALNAGNPENAVDVYAQKDPQMYTLHIDSRFFPGIDQYQCLTSKYPVFFVTRYDQRVGMDRFFSLEKSFLNPNKTYSLGIYTLKKDCDGKSLSLSDFYQKAMNKIFQTRSGIAY